MSTTVVRSRARQGRTWWLLAIVIAVGACGRAPHARSASIAPAPLPTLAACAGCAALGLTPDVTRAIEQRIADLTSRGADCSSYGAVLARSFRDQRITIRPYMWRMGAHLVSGEATPEGDMMLAREIDSLNVGVRTVDDLMRTMEHEAAHIAFSISSGTEANEARVNAYVQECSDDRSRATASTRATTERHPELRR